MELGHLSEKKVALIVRAAQEVIDGQWDDEFPLSVFQTGSGTQTNMNANEVIANLANRYAGDDSGPKRVLHPNDDVNRSQSTNDVFPTVMHIAAVEQIEHVLLPAVESLRDTFAAKSVKYAELVMLGRTHLQDATPITLGQIASGWAAQLDHAIQRYPPDAHRPVRTRHRRNRGRHGSECAGRLRRGRRAADRE